MGTLLNDNDAGNFSHLRVLFIFALTIVNRGEWL